MYSQKGGLTLIIIVILLLLAVVVGGGILFFFTQKKPNAISTQRIGEAIDLSKKPPAKYLPNYITHCNNTSGYQWTGTDCVPK